MQTQHHLSQVAMRDLPLQDVLKQNLERMSFTHCTPIQAQALPLALAGKDIAGQAQTGTGKTAAFLLATLDILLRQPPRPRDDSRGDDAGATPRALILAPTRELAVQIAKDCGPLAQGTGIRHAVVYGGTGYDEQRNAIAAGVDILIGTPGRLIDFLKQRLYTLRRTEVVVLDEADRMFDLGFISDIRFMLRRCPPPGQRRNFLFSATLSHRVMELAYEHMNSPQRVTIEPEQVTADRVRQSLIHVANDQKLGMLVGLLRHHDPLRTLLFVNTKRGADKVEMTLRANGFEARTLSGDVPQAKREKLLERFKDGELPVLVATDVAARGLHIPAVSHVINYDLPQDPEDYVHRIGRTARAGASGDAISLCCETWVYGLQDIERFIGARIPVLQGAEALLATDLIRPKDTQPEEGERLERHPNRHSRRPRPTGRRR